MALQIKIQWTKSREGYCTSKCGRFSISPLWCGRVKPVFWHLRDNQTGRETRSAFTQREAKATAQRWAQETV
jgi:hypothetical protein